ncbi:GbsR/MarR family transcriptional regulator [Prosthecobacter sp.]|jgi:DNA-binding transcriptional regulator GbsR (MarR family)|uniref:GbsR/MarR family transcriptional regulator n=1 Tax=Prosthecobacter sp. TaxID=1965333 RepID=UPI00378483B4
MSAAAPKTSRIDAPASLGAWDREVARFIDAAGNTTHSFGLGKLIGRLFALLYLSPEPLCLDQIADKLKISKASASITVRHLAAWNAVNKVEVENAADRRDFYEAELRFGVILRNGLLPGMRKKLRSAGVQIDRSLGAAPTAAQMEGMPAEKSVRHKEISRRLRLARGLHQKVNALFSSPLLEHLI